MSRPAPFEDSFSTSDATISVAVARPDGERDEAVIITIDCTGSVSLDEGATDLVLEMIEGAHQPRPAPPARATQPPSSAPPGALIRHGAARRDVRSRRSPIAGGRHRSFAVLSSSTVSGSSSSAEVPPSDRGRDHGCVRDDVRVDARSGLHRLDRLRDALGEGGQVRDELCRLRTIELLPYTPGRSSGMVRMVRGRLPRSAGGTGRGTVTLQGWRWARAGQPAAPRRHTALRAAAARRPTKRARSLRFTRN